MRLFLLALVVLCAHATPQYKTAGVKGGYSSGGHQYQGGENLINNYYSNSTHQQGYGGYAGRTNLSESVSYERGVCYIEVPTASLVRDPAHVPAGNGSRSDLSRIRSCCRGYIRNIHNYRICDPVCTHECINSLCSAPETCTCFPDHVKNLAGICVATCPIGCQNGYCSGGECLCKDGYRLDYEGKFCVPYCREQCGGAGRGNCTAPNTCECKNGLRPTPEGSCKPSCDRCKNGECVGTNECRCSYGYSKDRYGDCVPQCSIPCTPPNRCVAPNVCDNPSNPSITTTLSPYGQQPQYPNYPGNQPSNYPYNPYNPGSPQSNYPGGYPYPSNPGGQNQYPGYQPTNNTGIPQNNRPGTQQPYYPGSQNNSSYQHPSDSNQRPPYRPDGQSYTNIPGNQPSLYPDSQHIGPDQRPIPGSQSPNSSQALPNGGTYYPNSQNYPGSQYYPDQRPNPNSGYQPDTRPTNAEPFYPNSQYYPGQPNYPYNQNNQYQPNQPQNPSQTPGSQYQHIYPNGQLSNVELLCNVPCVNGTCVGRDMCTCNTGYVPIGGDSSRCEPYCTGCSNGVCVSPYVCLCNPGYSKDFSVKGRSPCVRRSRRSADTSAPINIADLLVFEIPDDYIN